MQQRVLQSVAQDQHGGRVTHSAAGLTYAAVASHPAVEHDPVNYARLDITPHSLDPSAERGELRITVSAEGLTDPAYRCAYIGQQVNNHNGTNVRCTAAAILPDTQWDIFVNSIFPEAVQLHTGPAEGEAGARHLEGHCNDRQGLQYP
ncbi:hypothetical protein JKF63_03812 [Porcisia hertigi]|uniref:Leishmanolysin n=1 Tax=Porcisia hertigi TaxID=2761500 RepID=A0A836ILV4_9TRYP|nr:hypothetical protein JKF63_03812 [Porcisia hertigi]